MGQKHRKLFSGTHEITVAADDVHEGIGTAGVFILDHDFDWLVFEVDNTDAEALDQFDLQIKPHADSEWTTAISSWANLAGEIWTSTALESLAATLRGVARVNVKGIYAIRFLASSDTEASDVTIEGCVIRDGFSELS